MENEDYQEPSNIQDFESPSIDGIESISSEIIGQHRLQMWIEARSKEFCDQLNSIPKNNFTASRATSRATFRGRFYIKR